MPRVSRPYRRRDRRTALQALAHRARGAPPPEPLKREYCTQVNESDFDFLSRILTEEGIHFHLEHGKEKSVVVLVNDPRGYAPIVGQETMAYRDAGGSVTVDHVKSITFPAAAFAFATFDTAFAAAAARIAAAGGVMMGVPNVLIGGFPMPSWSDVAKGLKKLGAALQRGRRGGVTRGRIFCLNCM